MAKSIRPPHPTLTALGAAGFKPDLLVHNPGDMEGNHAIIEVKSVQAARQNAEKDLNTLALFKSEVRYARAIYLIYGEEIDGAMLDRIAARYVAMKLTAPIELWFHVAPGEPAFLAHVLEPPR